MPRENRYSGFVALGFYFVLAAGCGSSGGAGSRSIYTFPDPAELQRLANHGHLDVRVFESDVVLVSSWHPYDLGEPLENSSELGELPWESSLREISIIRERQISPAPAMRCAARQIGLFMLEHGGQPDEMLRRYIVARCGSTETRIRFLGLTYSSTSTTTVDEALDRVRSGLREHFMDAPGARTLTVGSWVGRSDNRVVVAVVSGVVDARLGAIAQIAPHSEYVEVRGELVADAEHIDALINLGEYGVRQCIREVNSTLPRFSFRCPVHQGDSEAFVQVMVQRPGRYLMHPISTLLVTREGQQPAEWRRSTGEGGGGELADSAEFAQAVFRRINDIRREARLRPLAFEQLQSQLARRLAPHFFAAQAGSDSEAQADVIALGLAAGWDVDGLIRDGQFLSSMLSGSNDVDLWVDAVLEMPNGRYTFLNPRVSSLAFGGWVIRDGGGLAAIATSYEFFDETEVDRAPQLILERLRQERRRRGVEGSVEVVRLSGMEDRINQLGESQRSAQSVLRALIDRADWTWPNIPTVGWSVEFYDPRRVEFPEMLLRPGNLRVAIGLTVYRPEDSAWGQYALFVIVQSARS